MTLCAEEMFEEEEGIWKGLLLQLKKDPKASIDAALKVSGVNVWGECVCVGWGGGNVWGVSVHVCAFEIITHCYSHFQIKI